MECPGHDIPLRKLKPLSGSCLEKGSFFSALTACHAGKLMGQEARSRTVAFRDGMEEGPAVDCLPRIRQKIRLLFSAGCASI